jgi:hypothetical protein
LFRVEDPWRLRDLASVLRSLPETATSFRTLQFETPLSLMEVFLYQVEVNPRRRLRLLLKLAAGQSPADVFEQVLQRHGALPKLHYHVAQLLSPTGNAEKELQKGTAREALLAPERHIGLLSKAAKNARVQLDESIRRGKGGNRRSGDTPRDLFVNHLLEIYRDVSGKLPGLTNNPGLRQIQGPAAQFLRLALPRFGFPVATGSTLRRWIENFRREHKRKAALKQN